MRVSDFLRRILLQIKSIIYRLHSWRILLRSDIFSSYPKRAVFFTLLSIYLIAAGQIYQRAAHYFYDGIAIRDAGTTFNHLMSKGLFYVLKACVQHIEGPLQFLLLNGYCYFVGTFLPLSPRTMQFPNTLFTVITCIILFQLGRKFYSNDLGYLLIASLVLAPWLLICLRQPWYFNLLSLLLQSAVVLYYFDYLQNERKGMSQFLAPLSLALYLLIGLDWPIFLTFLAIFLFLSRKTLIVLRNPYNFIPFMAITYQLLVSSLFAYFYGLDGARYTALLYPFLKGGQGEFFSGWYSIIHNTLFGIWPQFLLALAFFFIFGRLLRNTEIRGNQVKSALLVAMSIWFLISAAAVFKTSQNIQYLYVTALPATFLSSLMLQKLRRRIKNVIIFGMAVFTALVLTLSSHRSEFLTPKNNDSHVLAVAGFILENRPQYLQKDKVAFLPRDRPACVGQYLRG